MRPVNLLPQSDRAVRPAEGLGGSSYMVLGILGTLLIAVVAFVFVSNQVNERNSQIATATTEADQAEQRANSLGAFGNFASVKAQREESVRSLAKARFDWERFMRELALVLPDGTSLRDVGTSVTTPEASATADPAAAAAPAGPQTQVSGCAKSQKRVAVLLVRLRSLYRAADVTLKESAVNDATSSDTSSSQDSATVGGSACGEGQYSFDVTVSFAPADSPTAGDSKPRRTPARLGGGA